jgi:hypothetical protein
LRSYTDSARPAPGYLQESNTGGALQTARILAELRRTLARDQQRDGQGEQRRHGDHQHQHDNMTNLMLPNDAGLHDDVDRHDDVDDDHHRQVDENRWYRAFAGSAATNWRPVCPPLRTFIVRK